MILRGIRSRLLGLVLAAVVPFTALIGVGLWTQWQDVQAAAIQQTINDARLLAAQVDDHTRASVDSHVPAMRDSIVRACKEGNWTSDVRTCFSTLSKWIYSVFGICVMESCADGEQK